MSLLFFDGFESYATADILKEWTSQNGSPTVDATGGRRGGGCLSSTTTSAATNVVKTLAASVSTFVAGFAFNPSASGAFGRSIAKFMDSGSNQLEIRLNSDATLSVTRNSIVLGTSTATVNYNSDQYIEFKATIHDTAGTYELRLNGVNILSGSGVDTKNTANASINQIMIGVDGNPGSSITWKYDDFYILDTSGATNNNFLGDVRIDAVYPNADGTHTDWTPSTGTDHYALVDEATPNTTDYVSSSTAGQKDSFNMASPPVLASEVIFGVRVKVAALKDDAGSRSIKVGVRSGTAESVSTAQALSTSQLYYSNIHEVDPDTGVAWTPSGIDNLQALVEAV